ncbi:MAG: 50S ribosomal protein L7/L12 [Bacteroides sp.]|nr:MAG: 50S ribosomal protein L7/L12 [Bacteroides sp.]
MTDLKSFAEKLVNLTVKEVNELSKILKSEYNIETNNISNNITSNENVISKKEIKKEKTIFKITLEEVGNQKLSVIKAIKEITGLSLKEAKEIVDNTPKIFKENVNKNDSDEIKKKLESLGAKVSLS